MRFVLSLLIAALLASCPASAQTIGSSASAIPGGSNTQLQYNNNGVFSGISGVTTDGVNLTSNLTFPANAAASTPGVTITGTVYSGGSSTTNFPLLYLNTAGASAPTTLSTGGTYFGINAASGFAGLAIDYHLNGGSTAFSVSSGGSVTSVGSINGNRFATSANISLASIGVTGAILKEPAVTVTDTASSGTIAAQYTNAFKAPTLAASSATTVTNAYNGYFENPVQGSNETLTNIWALGADNAHFGTSTPFTISTSGVPSANGNAGVSCASNTVTLATEVVTNGIVTHC